MEKKKEVKKGNYTQWIRGILIFGGTAIISPIIVSILPQAPLVEMASIALAFCIIIGSLISIEYLSNKLGFLPRLKSWASAERS